ncbi:hypothetical protein [Priestia aryabhattai]
MKRIYRGCLGAVIALFLIMLAVGGYYMYEVFVKETTVLTDTNANQTANIEIVQTGEPSFFGPTSIKVYYRKNNDYLETKTGTLYNDGGPATPSNFLVTWKNESNVTINLVNTEGASSEVIKFSH